MAYAAVTCLRGTILRLLNSSFSVSPSTLSTLNLAYEELGSLQEVLERSDRRRPRFEGLDERQIIRAAQKLEDLLEFHELKQLDSNPKTHGDAELMRHITSSLKTVKKIKQLYKRELEESFPDEEDGDDGDSDRDDNPSQEEEEEEEEDDDDDDDDDEEEEDDDDDDAEEEEDGEGEGEGEEAARGGSADGDDFSCNMVGLSENFNEIKISLVNKSCYVFSIIGMAGIGKTALAERILHDPLIEKEFKFRAFIRIGENYKLEKFKQDLVEANPKNDMEKDRDERLDEDVEEYLNDRYLIVLDDVWNLDFWDDYFEHRYQGDKAKGSCILLTTRLEGLIMESLEIESSYFLMPFLDKAESWDLLRRKIFAEKVCPPELEEMGKKIAEECDGLPLMIVKVGEILSKARTMNLEHWKKEAHKKSEVFQKAYGEILPVLYPSYNNLPLNAKACFLYMGAFPPNHEVPRSKLVSLWCIEEFLEPEDSSTSVKAFASECFDKLLYDHVVVPSGQLSSNGQMYKACSLHSVFRHLCNKEVEKNQFLHIMQSIDDLDGSERKLQRRVSIHNNVLLSIEAIRASMKSSSIRSLLCTGAYHKYQVPVSFDLRLLRVCDALTIRFYEFPSEVLKLVQLRYFAITCNQNLPPCISQLWKLEHLIVHQHLSINTTPADSFLPEQVWHLQELIHLQIMGRNLPNPPPGVMLDKLVKLLDVGLCSCTEAVLTSTPNLEKLRVQIQLTPNSSEPPLSHLDRYHISQLNRLLSFQCVIANPIILTSETARPSLSVSSSSITKLTLSGLGHPWEYLNKLAKQLPNLRVLKLLWFAFHGKKWEVEENGFLNLECLSIEESNLVQWEAGEETLPSLTHLTLKFCYELQQLPEISSLQQIELFDCNSSAEKCARQRPCYVASSWDETKVEKMPQNYASCIYQVMLQY